MPRTVPISKPLTTHKGEVTEIELRDITARDMVEMRVGPTSVSTHAEGIGNARVVSQKFDIRYDIAMGYLTRLSGIDEILLGSLKAADFDKCVVAIQELWNEAGE